MKQRSSFAMLLIPFFVLLVLAFSMLEERSGINYVISYPPMQFLPPLSGEINYNESEGTPIALVLFDSLDFAAQGHLQVVLDVLSSMRVRYVTADINHPLNKNYDDFDAVIVSFLNYDKAAKEIYDLFDWVENGGKVLISIRPDPSQTLNAEYRKLGISTIFPVLQDAHGVLFETDILPGAQGASIGLDFINHKSYPVELVPAATEHLKSSDNRGLPLLWQYDYDKGRFVVLNTDQFTTKISRGVIGASFSLLFDTFAYPVINSSVFFIDDFPGPFIPGSNEIIADEYGRSNQSFLTNVWWPDLESLTTKYGIKYTGALLETYIDETAPPFDKEGEVTRYKFFGGIVLDDGGELGLHGYNHVPLCPSTAGVNKNLDYPDWTNPEDMELSIFEAFRFSNEVFPDNSVQTYVPASNILCDEVRRWLPRALPDLRVISSVYLPSELGLAYEQEFEEADDGVIELPRISSGYELSDYFWWAIINELTLHYINSHYFHPTDVFHVVTEEKGWEEYFNQYENYVNWVTSSLPGLRTMTASEAGMAVQRFDRLVLNQYRVGSKYIIELENFYDEAQLMLRSDKVPIDVDGGTIEQVASNLYLVQASNDVITITFSE